MNKENIVERTLAKEQWVGKGKTVDRAFPFLLAVYRFRSVVKWLNAEHDLNLPHPAFTSARELKEFCGGLLENPSTHLWTRHLRDRHACLRARASVASTLFLFRKVLPAEKLSKKQAAKVAEKYIKKMTTPQDPAPSDFLDFVANETGKMFRPGWDHDWHNAADSFCLPVKSCIDNRAGAGGVRSITEWEQEYKDGRFIPAIQAKYEYFTEPDELVRKRVRIPRLTKVLTIWTGGKNRTISMFHAERSFLSPLHQIIYSHISKKPWLLRGDAEKKIFLDFLPKGEEVLVSGDYESATDNLNLSVSQTVLRMIRNHSTEVPTQVWDAAEEALTSIFEGGRVQTRGQLMGSLLSFPLLCIVNFLSFKWAVPRKVPVKINGDDIVFVATPEERDNWYEQVGKSGLVLSKGKTLCTRSLFSLNSTFFLARRRGEIEEVPIIRSTCVWNPPDSCASVQGRLQSACRKFSKEIKNKVLVETLRTCSKWVNLSQRSLQRGLQCRVSPGVIRGAGLMKREVFYNALDEEPLCPPPFKRWQHWGLPTGWRSEVKTDGSGDDVGAMHALVSSTWGGYTTHKEIDFDAYLNAVRDRTFRYVPLSRRAFKMLGPCPFTFEEIENTLKKKIRNLQREGERVWRKVHSSVLTFVRAS
nr:MAG: RNA-dependent RNA polymerase [Erysiphe necator associated ourmia-like virus 97]